MIDNRICHWLFCCSFKFISQDYIFFLDSDDYLKADCIANMVDKAKTGKLVVMGYMIDDMASSTVFAPQQYSGSYDDVTGFLHDFHKYFATKFNFSWGKLFRKEIIKKNNIRFIEGMSLSEDVLFNIEYYKHCSEGVIVIEDKGYYYRQSDNSTLSKRFNPRMFEWNETAYCMIRNFLNEQMALTPSNRVHFYSDVMGNLLYSTGLLALQSDVSRGEKVKLIRTYTNTTLVKETIRYSKVSSTRGRMMAFLLKQGMVNTYIVANQMIQIIKKHKR